MLLNRYNSILDLEEGKALTAEQINEMRRYQHHSNRVLEMLSMEAGLSPSVVRRVLRSRKAPPPKKD